MPIGNIQKINMWINPESKEAETYQQLISSLVGDILMLYLDFGQSEINGMKLLSPANFFFHLIGRKDYKITEIFNSGIFANTNYPNSSRYININHIIQEESDIYGSGYMSVSARV